MFAYYSSGEKMALWPSGSAFRPWGGVFTTDETSKCAGRTLELQCDLIFPHYIYDVLLERCLHLKLLAVVFGRLLPMLPPACCTPSTNSGSLVQLRQPQSYQGARSVVRS